MFVFIELYSRKWIKCSWSRRTSQCHVSIKCIFYAIVRKNNVLLPLFIIYSFCWFSDLVNARGDQNESVLASYLETFSTSQAEPLQICKLNNSYKFEVLMIMISHLGACWYLYFKGQNYRQFLPHSMNFNKQNLICKKKFSCFVESMSLNNFGLIKRRRLPIFHIGLWLLIL